MQGWNRGGLEQDSTYSELRLLVMLVLLLCSIGIKKQRYWCFCFWLFTFPTKLEMPLLFFHYGLLFMLVSLLSSEVHGFISMIFTSTLKQLLKLDKLMRPLLNLLELIPMNEHRST